MAIRILPSSEIDKLKWDSCVHYAVNGNIFGYSWYLQNVGAEWIALVEGDYQAVMPIFLTEKGWLRKKTFLKTPNLIRDAGPYTTSVLSAKRLQNFLAAIKALPHPVSKIKFSGFLPASSFGDVPIQTKEQRALLLVKGYDALVGQFSSGFKEQVDTNKHDLLTISNLRPEKFAEFYIQNRQGMGETERFAIMRICYQVLHRGWGFFSGIQNRTGKLLAAGFFVVQANKGILLFGAQSEKGKQAGALPYLLHRYIQTNAGKPVLLDFNVKLGGLTLEETALFGAEVFYTVNLLSEKK